MTQGCVGIRAFDAVFQPRNIAVIRATDPAASVGHVILWNMITDPLAGDGLRAFLESQLNTSRFMFAKCLPLVLPSDDRANRAAPLNTCLIARGGQCIASLLHAERRRTQQAHMLVQRG
jgi:hypothetical protein